MNLNGYRVVYLVVSKGGGVDGRDPSDKGGFVKLATLDPKEAEESCDAWHEVEVKAIDMIKQKELAEKKLGALDRLALGLNVNKQKLMR